MSATLIACSHGTRSADGRAAISALLDQVRALLPDVRVVEAFVDVQQPEIAELRPQFAREAVVAVDVRGQRCDTLRGELRHGVAQGVDVFSEAEVEVLHLKCSIGQVGESEQACESCPIVRQSDRVEQERGP